MNKKPYVVGYWARVRGLRMYEVADDPAFGLDDYDGAAAGAFRDGWKAADAELRAEKVAELKRDLAAVVGAYDADDATLKARRPL